MQGFRNVSRIEKTCVASSDGRAYKSDVFVLNSISFLQRFELAAPRASIGQQVVFYLDSMVIYFKVESGF